MFDFSRRPLIQYHRPDGPTRTDKIVGTCMLTGLVISCAIGCNTQSSGLRGTMAFLAYFLIVALLVHILESAKPGSFGDFESRRQSALG